MALNVNSAPAFLQEKLQQYNLVLMKLLAQQRDFQFLVDMDPRFIGEILKHLEKQNELLSESHSSITHELHKVQVEEQMLMRKFYQLMESQGLNRKNKNNDNISDKQSIAALVGSICNEDEEPENSTAVVSTRNKPQ